jgi:hypothetical protein
MLHQRHRKINKYHEIKYQQHHARGEISSYLLLRIKINNEATINRRVRQNKSLAESIAPLNSAQERRNEMKHGCSEIIAKSRENEIKKPNRARRMKLRNRLRAAINSAIINRKAGKPVLSGS